MIRLDKRKEESRSVLTLSEAAEYLKVCRQTLVKKVREGKIPCFLIGKQYRFNEEELRLSFRKT